MKIKEKLEQVKEHGVYNFIGIDFNIYDTDYIRVYNNDSGTCIYNCNFSDYKDIPEDLGNIEPIKEELAKVQEELKSPYAICFYIGEKKEKVEKPISARVNYR